MRIAWLAPLLAALTLAGGLALALALLLGYAISWSFIGPVKPMEGRLGEIAAGDFGQWVAGPNRDELGTLAADLTCQASPMAGEGR